MSSEDLVDNTFVDKGSFNTNILIYRYSSKTTTVFGEFESRILNNFVVEGSSLNVRLLMVNRPTIFGSVRSNLKRCCLYLRYNPLSPSENDFDLSTLRTVGLLQENYMYERVKRSGMYLFHRITDFSSQNLLKDTIGQKENL